MSEAITSLLIEQQPAIDSVLWALYQGLGQAGSNEWTSDGLLPSPDVVALERKRFTESDGTLNPDLRPRELDVAAIVASDARHFEYKIALEESTEDHDLRDIYRWRINERIANLRMLQAVANGDKLRFAAYNHFIYGEPDAAIFQAVADEFCIQAEAALHDGTKDQIEPAEIVLESLADYRGDRTLLTPSEGNFTRQRELHMQPDGYYPLLLDGVTLPKDTTINRLIGDPILEHVIRNLGSNFPIEDAVGKSWSLNGAVRRPVGYDLPSLRFKGLVLGHEVGSHLLEIQNGNRSPVRLTSSGLDRYELANEGRAVSREQVVYSSFDEFAKLVRWQDILRRHLATSLAYGLTGALMDFTQTHSVICAIDTVRERGRKPNDIAAADKGARNRSWSLLSLIFKGTDGTGRPYGRYASYLEGNLAYWKLAEHNPDVILHGDRGKSDLTNSRHSSFLRKVGIIPTVEYVNAA